MAGMANGMLAWALAILLAAAAQAVAAPQAQGCSRVMRVPTGDWPPYNYFDADQRYRGLDVELLSAIFAEAGCSKRDAAPMPSPRNTRLFEQGQLDLMAGASITPARRELARFSVRYREEVISLFVLDKDAARYRDIRSYEQFLRQPLTLLAPKIGWYGAAYERSKPALLAAARLSEFIQIDQGISMLAAGRATFILADSEAAVHGAARQGIVLRALPFQVSRAPVHLMFNKATTTEADVNTINAAIDRLEKRGVLEGIRRAYRPATAW